MKKLRRWLLPVLMFWAVFAAAFLPSKISQFRDKAAFGRVHTENLAGDSNFPSWELEMSDRLVLLYNYLTGASPVTEVAQELENEELIAETEKASQELLSLSAECGMLTTEGQEILQSTEFYGEFGSRIYLQARNSLAGASFLIVRASSDFGDYLYLIRDEITGMAVYMELSSGGYYFHDSSIIGEFGTAFFNRLGVESELLEESFDTASFQIGSGEQKYRIWLTGNLILIEPYQEYQEFENGSMSIAGEKYDDPAPRYDAP